MKDIKLGLASYGVVYGLVDFGLRVSANAPGSGPELAPDPIRGQALLFAVLRGVVARCGGGFSPPFNTGREFTQA